MRTLALPLCVAGIGLFMACGQARGASPTTQPALSDLMKAPPTRTADAWIIPAPRDRKETPGGMVAAEGVPEPVVEAPPVAEQSPQRAAEEEARAAAVERENALEAMRNELRRLQAQSPDGSLPLTGEVVWDLCEIGPGHPFLSPHKYLASVIAATMAGGNGQK
ncbi:MAG: hypothetical protein ACE15C_05010 [Phycisphaerae bacterium]